MAIELRSVCKRFGELDVLDRITLRFEERRITAVLGPSGCGKTTLLGLVAGIDRPDEGEIIGAPSGRIGFAFQEPRLLPWLTVHGNLDYVLKDVLEPAQRSTAIQRWLDLVGLSGFSSYYPSALSGGMRQRVSLARAFAVPAELLLLDEPFQALDLQRTLSLIEVFNNAWAFDRRTAIVVTHDVREALLVADDLYVLSERPSRVVTHLHLDGDHAERTLTDRRTRDIEQKLLSLVAARPASRERK